MAVFMIILANPIKFRFLINDFLRLFYAISIFLWRHIRMLFEGIGESGYGIKTKLVRNFRKRDVLPY